MLRRPSDVPHGRKKSLWPLSFNVLEAQFGWDADPKGEVVITGGDEGESEFVPADEAPVGEAAAPSA